MEDAPRKAALLAQFRAEGGTTRRARADLPAPSAMVDNREACRVVSAHALARTDATLHNFRDAVESADVDWTQLKGGPIPNRVPFDPAPQPVSTEVADEGVPASASTASLGTTRSPLDPDDDQAARHLMHGEKIDLDVSLE